MLARLCLVTGIVGPFAVVLFAILAQSATWTATGPVLYGWLPVENAARYRVYNEATGARIAEVEVPCVRLLCGGVPLRLSFAPVAADGTEGERSLAAETLLACGERYGADLDGSGTVDASDFGMRFAPAFEVRSRSLASRTPEELAARDAIAAHCPLFIPAPVLQ